MPGHVPVRVGTQTGGEFGSRWGRGRRRHQRPSALIGIDALVERAEPAQVQAGGRRRPTSSADR